MADKKPGFFKRLFKFGKKKESDDNLEVVEDATSDTALGDDQAPDPVAHAEAAANVIVDTEAGADPDAPARIEPIADTPPPPAKDEIDQAAAARQAKEEAEKRRREASAEAERAEAERLSAQKAEAEKAEAKRIEAEQEAARAAEEEAERKRAQEKREAEAREAAQKAEAEKLALEERERKERERAEQEAIKEVADIEEAARREAEAEKARIAEETRLQDKQAERDRIAAEEEQQRAAAAEEQARQEAEEKRLEDERLAKEAAAREAEAQRLAETEREAAAQAEREAEAEAKAEAEEARRREESRQEQKESEKQALQVTADSGEAPAKKVSWFNRLKGGLSRSSTQLTESITGVFTKKKLDDDTLQDLEDILIRADLGVETAMSITEKLAAQRMGKDVSSEEVRGIMADEIETVLDPVAAELELDLDHQPHVILVVGVNGSGKTTTIGKLSQKLYDAGFSTLLVAGDTFRAAAIEQLKIWGDRTQSPVLSRPLGADAAGLAFDAYEQAKEEGRDVMLMDTAGRLQNRTELMEELAKIVRVLKKQDPAAPHTVLLTLDATTGQNALNQVEIFKDIAGVNGLVMTKLDGTARGGILVAISAKHKLPVFFLGVGEQVDDLEPFEARDFARSIAGLN